MSECEVKEMDSELEDLISDIKYKLVPNQINTKMSLNEASIKSLLEYAVNSALQAQATMFKKEIEDLKKEIEDLKKEFKSIEHN